jgi:peptidoglycan/xylan/chitin deacetylase (PgdA/CDA1 family)
MRVWVLAGLMAVATSAAAGQVHGLIEPTLHLPASPTGQTRVALTFDACDGHVDRRILDALEAGNIPATIFVSGKWLARNPAAFAELLAHPDLFEVEDHGARHVPAVDYPTRVYGLRAAGSPEAVRQELAGGADALTAAGAPVPHWYRGAAAEYDSGAMTIVTAMGYRIAGFSVNGDSGSMASVRQAARVIGAARDGDVIIAHINQPTHVAGAGVVAGIAALQARGVVFVRLEDAFPAEGVGPS